MGFDNGWKALLAPGSATRFFDVENPKDFQVDALGYSPVNAWWLAELSRLIHRPRRGRRTRDPFLEQAGLRELGLSVEKRSCTVVESTRGERFAVLIFRGSVTAGDWVTNFNAGLVNWPGGGRVHRGFKAALDKLWPLIDERLDALACPVFYTGHSLGGALATLAASRRPPRAAYTFGSPRVGDRAFGETLAGRDLFRIANNRDIGTTVPPSGVGGPYRHVGETHYVAHDDRILVDPDPDTVRVDRRKSDPALRSTTDFRAWYYPPHFLADHTPVNYVAHMARQAW